MRAKPSHKSDASFVIVPTPSDSTGFFSNRFVLQAMESLGKALRNKTGYHMVVITSTVMPGTTGSEIKAALEAASGRKVGPDLGLCYNPEFIALGSVVRDMLFPDSILIGESDAKAGDMLQTIYLQMCENKPPVQRMNFINAELTKISVNTYVTTKISYANMLADICDRLPGADVDAVTKALGADTRIGPKYLKGAMGYGGPCFPRDNVAFAALARKIGARADVAEATDRINNYQVDRLTALVGKFAKAGTRIAILGLSYKPQTPVVEESHSVKLAAKLADAGYVVVVHDPLAQDTGLAVLGDKVVGASSIEGAVRGLRPADRRHRLARVQGDRSGVVQTQRPAPDGARPVAHAAGRQVRCRGRRALSGVRPVGHGQGEGAGVEIHLRRSVASPAQRQRAAAGRPASLVLHYLRVSRLGRRDRADRRPQCRAGRSVSPWRRRRSAPSSPPAWSTAAKSRWQPSSGSCSRRPAMPATSGTSSAALR